MKKVLLFSILLLSISCKKHEFSEIQKGMDEKQVIQFLGKPDGEQNFDLFGMSVKMMRFNKQGIVVVNNLTGKVTRTMTPEEAEKSFNDLGKTFEKK